MDELVRRAALDGRLRRIYRLGLSPDGGKFVRHYAGHVVQDPGMPATIDTCLTKVEPPSPGLLKQAMREEWKLAR